MSYFEAKNITCEEAIQLIKCIDIIKSQECLMNLKISDYPGMTKESRSKLFNSFKKTAYPIFNAKEEKPITTEDLANILSGYRNG